MPNIHADIKSWLIGLNEIRKALGLCSLIFVIISLAIIGSWYLRGAADIQFEVKTDYVAFDIEKVWDWEIKKRPLRLNRLYIENIDTAYLNDKNSHLMPRIGLEGKYLEAENIRLSVLEIIPVVNQREDSLKKNRPCSIDVDANDSSLLLTVRRAKIVGRYELNDSRDMPPESVFFQTLANDEVPMTIIMEPKHTWAFIHLKASKIHFDKQEGFDKDNPFISESQITSGQLTILDTKKSVSLSWADCLWVRGIQENRRLTLEKSQNEMKVTFLGRACRVNAGPKGFEEDLRPRYLGKFQNSALPVGLFIALYSFLWSILKFFWNLQSKGL